MGGFCDDMAMAAMNDLERFRACTAYEPVDRAPFWDWGGRPETIERWKREGHDPERFNFPVEVQCGMDVSAVRRKYGRRLRIRGGVDQRAPAAGPEAIDAELERLRPLIAEGGYIPHTDHTCPRDISCANYCHYLGRLGKVCRGR